MDSVLITGGTGLIGKALHKHLILKGYKVIILTRNIPAHSKGVTYALWDIEKKQVDHTAIQQADFIIHLAGAGVMDKRWTASYKEKIIKSRTDSSILLADSLEKYPNSVKAVVSASAIGWYGTDRPGHIFTEEDLPAKDFLGETCRLWEQSIDMAGKAGIRIVKLRSGIVLSNEGGALKEFAKTIKFGIAAIPGNGKQCISWIHITDLCRMYQFALENVISGSYNAVAPGTITNKELNVKLAALKKRKFFIPLHIPPFIIRLILGEQSIEVMKSTTVSSKKIKGAGFTFLYPSIEAALQNLDN
ncbi:MAG TPA: TIGR01777 family oxidoreductase [Ferruginibacter sp.]|nr:TIGR01777 family oxidoreductase [Ferruginibacter sp.]